MSETPSVPAEPALYVGLVGDAPRTPPTRIALSGLARVELGRGDRRRLARREVDGAAVVALALADPRMSSQHAQLIRAGTRWVLEDVGSRNGTWLGSQRITRRPLQDGDAIVVGHTALVFREDGGEAGDLDGAPPPALPGLATFSPRLATRLGELAAVARDRIPIQLTGEPGTGKERIARAVHEVSGRPGAFVAVSCASVPASAIEAAVLGVAPEDRAGAVREADRGTLFLDQLDALPRSTQAVLRGILEHGAVTPIGGAHPVAVDVRPITATHRELDVEVGASRLAPELRARITGFELRVPPLRQRLEDLALLVAATLDRLAPGRAITFSSDAVAALYAHDWPLNLRELERSLGAALAATAERGTDRIELDHLPAAVGDTESLDPEDRPIAPGGGPIAPGATAPKLSDQDRALRDTLAAAIARHGGNLAGVARELGKDRTQIRRWMKRFGLTRENVAE